MIPQPPPGQGPIDPRGAFSPPPPPGSPQQAPGGPLPAPYPYQQTGMFAPPPPPGYPQPYGPGGMRPMPYPPFPPPRRSVGRILFWMFVLIVLCISIVLNLVLLASNLGGSGGNQTVLNTGNGTDKVVIIPITGEIDEHTAVRFDRFMKRAEAESGVKAIVLRIDTPGGTVTASDEIYARLLRYKQERKEKGQAVPVIVSMGGFATSGGYYAACAGDYLFAEHTTITGNIGVLWPQLNFSKLLDKYGVEDLTVVSSGTPYKDAGSSTRAPRPEHEQYMQHLIDVPFKRFKDVVKTGRASSLTKGIDDIANGQAYTADDAKTLGLVDDIGYLDNAIKYAVTKTGVSNPMVVKYQDPPTFFGLLESESRFIGHREEGVTIHVDASAIDRLTAPRMMYLYRGAESGAGK